MDLAGIPYLREIDRPIERGPRADPNFPHASEAIADKVVDPVAIMLGVPYSGGSLSGAKCDQTPAAVRGALPRFSAYSTDYGVALEVASILDAGNVDAKGDVEDVERRIEACVRALSSAGVPLAVVGGDNSITAGAAAGADADALITFDAHHDVRDGATNGSPVRRLVEAGLPGERIIQIGIHGFANSRFYTERAAEYGIRWVPATAVRDRGMRAVLEEAIGALAAAGASRIWCDFDIDVLDRAFSPGTAASLPGGLWPQDLEQAAFIAGADERVRGIDITEVDPSTDLAGMTVRVACAVLLSYLAGVESR
ncbi:MAG TPA: arginase family protein [Actinomycetota bacterium]|nr:arginase family protein [Actinomycetota bacterium]